MSGRGEWSAAALGARDSERAMRDMPEMLRCGLLGSAEPVGALSVHRSPPTSVLYSSPSARSSRSRVKPSGLMDSAVW